MSTIPTRIRQHIRDHITAETAPLQAELAALSKLLGYQVTLDPEWGMLWAMLQPHYPDQATFIPTVALVVSNWCAAFTTWIEDDANSEAVERLLEQLSGWQALKLALEIAPTSTRPVTSWRVEKSAFVIGLPKARPSSPSIVLAGFASDLLALFTASPSAGPVRSPALPTAPSGAAAGGAEDPDAWADLLLDSPVARPVRREREREREICDVLPDVSVLERPEELTRSPPYYIVVRQVGNGRIEVQCSHQGSLLVLEGYLKKWARHSTDYTNRPPIVDIKLRESPFGLGLLYDTLIMEGIRGREVGATLVLVLIEGVLGYDPVPDAGAAGAVWEFKRTKPFK